MTEGISNVLILGVNGGFGASFSALLSDRGIVVYGTDRADHRQSKVRCVHYAACDVTAPTEEVTAMARQADCLLFCLPEAVALTALETFAAVAAPGALLVDTLSVKTPIASIVTGVRADVQHLSINPMFAPEVGFAGQNVAAVAVADGPRCASFVSLMEAWGSRVVLMSVDDHDRQTAITQVATHAAILGFGYCLERLGYDAETAWSIATPPHRILMALVARIAGKDPEVYWEIQVDNPFAEHARETLLDCLKDIDDMVRQNRRKAFHSATVASKEVMGPIMPALMELSDRLIRSA
jgi:prephenate dehydrogenase